MISQATLVLANHRPETVPAALALMAGYDAVILEEPPDDGFQAMLEGRLDIDTYLAPQDLEYPEFSHRMAQALRERHRLGTRLYQVEPFIEHLLAIHDRFADGQGPSDLTAGTTLHQVYLAERAATKALIDFYSTSSGGSFSATLAAVKRFARADARRFDLRDRLRAAAMPDLLQRHRRTYIEAGQIHYPLWRELRRRLPADVTLRIHFLMAGAVRGMGRHRHLYGPGDRLTLLYRFHPDGRFREADRLAAQALIYNKIIIKEEMSETAEPFPHTRDELEVAAITDRLTIDDCRRLYPVVRRAATATAREMVRHYLHLKGGTPALTP